jgi:hypothetical protein
MALNLFTIFPSGSPTGSSNLSSTVSSIANTVLGTLFVVAGILAIIYLVWSGFQYIISRGEPDRAKTARAGVINAIIGIVVVASAYGIIKLAVSLATAANGVIGGTNGSPLSSGDGGGVNNAPTDGSDTTVIPGGGGHTNAGDDPTVTLKALHFTPVQLPGGSIQWCHDGEDCIVGGTLTTAPTDLSSLSPTQGAGINLAGGVGTLTWYSLDFSGTAKWCHGDDAHCLTTGAREALDAAANDYLDGNFGSGSASDCQALASAGANSGEQASLNSAASIIGCTSTGIPNPTDPSSNPVTDPTGGDQTCTPPEVFDNTSGQCVLQSNPTG